MELQPVVVQVAGVVVAGAEPCEEFPVAHARPTAILAPDGGERPLAGRRAPRRLVRDALAYADVRDAVQVIAPDVRRHAVKFRRGGNEAFEFRLAPFQV